MRNLISRGTVLPSLACFGPVINDWLVAVAERLRAHAPGTQPWWIGSHELARSFGEAACRQGWRVRRPGANDDAPAWDLYLDGTGGQGKFAARMMTSLLSISDADEAVQEFQRTVAIARAAAVAPLPDERQPVVVVFAAPYLRAADAASSDIGLLIERWATRSMSRNLEDAGLEASVLIRTDVPTNAANWRFPGVGLVAFGGA